MVLGVGVDLLKMDRIAAAVADPDDPFLKKMFTRAEHELIGRRQNRLAAYATRFAAKEAVFKCLDADGDEVRLGDIEVLAEETGRPRVLLHKTAAKAAEAAGITRVLLSLSWDGDYAVAYATAVGGTD